MLLLVVLYFISTHDHIDPTLNCFFNTAPWIVKLYTMTATFLLFSSLTTITFHHISIVSLHHQHHIYIVFTPPIVFLSDKVLEFGLFGLSLAFFCLRLASLACLWFFWPVSGLSDLSNNLYGRKIGGVKTIEMWWNVVVVEEKNNRNVVVVVVVYSFSIYEAVLKKVECEVGVM